MEETIALKCGGCENLIGVSADLVGKLVRCPHCKRVVQIPAFQEPDDTVLSPNFSESINTPIESNTSGPTAVFSERPRETPHGSIRLISILLPYSIAATIVSVFLFVHTQQPGHSPHPLETLADQGLYEELHEGRRTIAEPNQPLSEDLPPVRLNETRRFGYLDVTPLSVEARKLHFEFFRGIRDFESDQKALVLTLTLSNASSDLIFHPNDSLFNRSFRDDAPPYTFLQMGNKRYYGAVADPKSERLRGQNFGPLLPGESLETIITTGPDDDVISKVRRMLEEDEKQEIIWRVQLRKGRETVTLSDGCERTVWATIVVPIAIDVAPVSNLCETE